jgi:hypothetical protein
MRRVCSASVASNPNSAKRRLAEFELEYGLIDVMSLYDVVVDSVEKALRRKIFTNALIGPASFKLQVWGTMPKALIPSQTAETR